MTKAQDCTPYDVRGAARRVSEAAKWVRVDQEAITQWAAAVDPVSIRPAPRPAELRFQGSPRDTARWVLLIDCLNFCFWASEGELWSVEYEGRRWQRYPALVAALRRAIARDPAWLTARRWAAAQPAELEELFAGHGRIPMFEDRVRLVQETGRVLIGLYDGEAMNLVEAADFDAARIAALTCRSFEGFRDIASYRGQSVPILKRAQIFASDLAAAWAENNGPTVTGIESLTAFADYRIPQMLRHLGILRLDPDFADRIEREQLIPASSEEEIELRACSIWAVELMAETVSRQRGASFPAWMVDEYLWDHSHDPAVTLRHHRTVTWFY